MKVNKVISTEVSRKTNVAHILWWPFAHDTSVAIAPSSSLCSERITGGYLATVLRTSAKILASFGLQIPASRCPKLSPMPLLLSKQIYKKMRCEIWKN